jgi:lysophospholipase L1-like esterase
LEGNVYGTLHVLRNYFFGIKSTTVRKMVRARYALNMESLRDTLNDCSVRGIPVLLYIAPIRKDKHIPYDPIEYGQWKHEVHEIAEEYGARLVNLEDLVPGGLWGTYTDDEIDFMHFRGPGHRLVAEALLPHVKMLIENKRR